MPYIREAINPSPTSVTMPYLRRYVILTNRHGARAFDLYETMNRIAYFRDNRTYRYDTSNWNIDILSQARNGEINISDTVMYEMTFENPTDPVERMSANIWFDIHGVRVDMAVYNEQEWDIAAADATDTVEHAHLLWNLWDDGIASQSETDEESLSDISGLFEDAQDVEAEIDDFMDRLLN
jgi:hypothetical protein